MSITQTVATDSFKEVTNRATQPGLEAVYNQPLGVTYAQSLAQPPPVPVPGTGKRKVYWLFVAVAVLGFAVVGLAVGLGVGLTRGLQNDSDSDSDSDSNTSAATTQPDSTDTPPSNPASDPSSTPTTIYTTTLTATPSATPSSICPSANNTIVTQSLGPTRYRIHCDSDIGGRNKITLASIVLPSFDECLALCNTMNYFQERTDVGCTYNVAGTGTQTPGTCWCLGGEGIGVVENVGNEVAMPV
ncbi:hypothetical protein BJX61DRAFT_544767 [Aspergillus egyptiacus]|nr:hypothetical protein BJX61DRAFT_544767 [Aspergillus egyptiacus]